MIMSTFKKYLLVNPDKYEQLLSKVQLSNQSDIFTHPNIKTVKKIDSKMSDILNNNHKTDREKIEEYSENLDSYLRNFKNALDIPKREAILGKPNTNVTTSDITKDQSENKSNKLTFTSVPENIPPSYRPNASHLLSFLTKNKNFDIGQNGNLKYKGNSYFQSDYNKLLDSVVRFKNPHDGKTDVNKFVSVLKQEGYPVNRLGYVRRSNIPSSSTKSISSVQMTKKPSKLHNTIERLSSGHTPKKTSPSKILKKWSST